MAFKKRTGSATVGAAGSFTVSLGASYGVVHGFKAVTGVGGDTTAKIKLTDADSRVFYLDAADTDYTTATGSANQDRIFTYDDTLTGLTVQSRDATGAAAAAGEPVGLPVVRSPITVAWSDGTAGDVLTISLYVEV